MTTEEFRQAAYRLVGEEYGWQSRIADRLGVHRSTASRWLAGRYEIPTSIQLAIEVRLAAKAAVTRGHDDG